MRTWRSDWGSPVSRFGAAFDFLIMIRTRWDPSRERQLCRARGQRLVVHALLACSLGATGCDLIVNTKDTQCDTDADCAARGPQFAGTMCTSKKVCGREPCTTSHECVEILGEPSYCRSDLTCTRLFTEDCKAVVPAKALDEDELILIGYMGPLVGENASYGLPTKEGAELAIDEIEHSVHGLLPVDGGSQRHLGMLVCDDDHDGQSGQRPAHHLVDDVQVPAIIGPAYSRITVAVTTEVTIPANVLVMSASATSPQISTLDDHDLVWRTVPSDAVQAEALRWLLPNVEMEHGLTSDSANVAMVVKKDSYGEGIQQRATKVYDQDGGVGTTSPAIKPTKVVAYDAPTSGRLTEQEANRVAGLVIGDAPDIIFDFGTTEFVTDVLPKIEMSGPNAIYLVPEGGRVTELSDFVRTQKPTMSRRVLGTAPGARRSAGYREFEERFQGTFSHPPGNLAEFAYDAVYLIAYAIAISHQPRPTGIELAKAMRNVTPPCVDNPNPNPPKVPAGFEDIARYFGIAANLGCIDFEGASGPLDFNANGEADSDIATWCVSASGDNPFPQLDTYYDAAIKQLVGNIFSCQ